MDKKQTLLVVDDDQEIRELLADLLVNKYGYDVVCACHGQDMFQQLEQHTVDLIVLDIMMPGDDGFELCRKLRMTSQIPIIMLTANGDETDRVVGLEVGADDYLSKPFSPRELVARIRAVLRRSEVMSTEAGNLQSEQSEDDTASFNGWVLDMATRHLTSPDGIEISLSSGEYSLLAAFINHPRRVLSRDQLLELTRNRSAGPFDRSIDIQVSRLRQKIEDDPKKPEKIKTVRGGGYMFTSAVERVTVDG